MAAPQFVPTDPIDAPRTYRSPRYVPQGWSADRPGAVEGRQPDGPCLGNQGPDQGYALSLASRLRPRIVVQDGERVDDAVAGCLGIALRRASLFGRAPVIHDLTVALTVWGFLDHSAPAELVALRGHLFEGVALVGHHYATGREIVDSVPEATLRMTPSQVAEKWPAEWRDLLGR